MSSQLDEILEAVFSPEWIHGLLGKLLTKRQRKQPLKALQVLGGATNCYEQV